MLGLIVCDSLAGTGLVALETTTDQARVDRVSRAASRVVARDLDCQIMIFARQPVRDSKVQCSEQTASLLSLLQQPTERKTSTVKQQCQTGSWS